MDKYSCGCIVESIIYDLYDTTIKSYLKDFANGNTKCFRCWLNDKRELKLQNLLNAHAMFSGFGGLIERQWGDMIENL